MKQMLFKKAVLIHFLNVLLERTALGRSFNHRRTTDEKNLDCDLLLLIEGKDNRRSSEKQSGQERE